MRAENGQNWPSCRGKTRNRNLRHCGRFPSAPTPNQKPSCGHRFAPGNTSIDRGELRRSSMCFLPKITLFTFCDNLNYSLVLIPILLLLFHHYKPVLPWILFHFHNIIRSTNSYGRIFIEFHETHTLCCNTLCSNFEVKSKRLTN